MSLICDNPEKEMLIGPAIVNTVPVDAAFDNQAEEFLIALYGQKPPPGFINICEILKNNNGVIADSYESTKIKEIVEKVLNVRTRISVYLEICMMGEASQKKSRGNANLTSAMPGIWVDVDVAGPGHASDEYPKTMEEALEFIKELKPTLIIDTGGGYHVYHLFHEPWVFTDKADRKKAKKLSQDAQRYMINKGKERGWKIDNTSDLARLLRIPGTYNHKTKEKREVRIVFYDSNIRYTPEDLLPPDVQIPDVQIPEQPKLSVPQAISTELVVQYPPSDAANVYEHCGFVRHCVEDAMSLTEPEWFLFTSIIAHCENGAAFCHQCSAPYSGYTVAETDKKIANVMKFPPVTCVKIQMNAQADPYCSRCPFQGHIKSPISLGDSSRKMQLILSGAKIMVGAVSDSGLPFEKESLQVLNILKREYPDSYNRIRGEIAKLGISVTSIENIMQTQLYELVDSMDFSKYVVTNNQIFFNKLTKHGEMPVLLCNFAAKIIEEIIRDDGVNRSIVFKIAAELYNGTRLPDVEIGAEEFRAMQWVMTNYGASAIIQPGQIISDHIRTAIQVFSRDHSKRTVYAHTGWRKIDNEWRFLTGSGALGKDGLAEDVEIQLEGKLKHYAFEKSLLDYSQMEAVTASLTLLKVAPYSVTIPLLSVIYRAPLEEAVPCHMSVFIAGQTGTFKSELTGLALAHFGPDFNGKNLTAEWTSTANALEKIAFIVKDAICVIDDYYPGTSQNEANKMSATADRVIRGRANDSGRARMSADGGLRVTFTPRSLILTTGEDIPKGTSLRARMHIIEIAKGDVDTTVLTKLQTLSADGMLAAAMVGYLRWLAPQMDELKKTLKSRKNEIRDEVIKDATAHTRTPDVNADLLLGLEFFLKYALEIGAYSTQQAIDLWDAAEKTLILSNDNMKEMLETDDPVNRFISLLMAAFVSGVAHVVSMNGGEPPNCERWGWKTVTISDGPVEKGSGKMIGWLDFGNLYLDADASFAAAQEIAAKQGSPITITPTTLRKRLHERGILVKDSKGGYIRAIKIGKHNQKVMHIKTEKIGVDISEENAVAVQNPFSTILLGGVDIPEENAVAVQNPFSIKSSDVIANPFKLDNTKQDTFDFTDLFKMSVPDVVATPLEIDKDPWETENRDGIKLSDIIRRI